jgi:hypothetical protein
VSGMSELVGDLMAVADEGYGAGGRKKRVHRTKSAADGADRDAYRDPSARTERGPLDDKSLVGAGKGDAGRDESRFLTGPSAPFGMTKKKFPPKQMGELWELDFLRKALGMGMIVSKPWGDSYRYDFVVDTAGKLWRVQVRATESRFGARGYAVHASVYKGRKIVGLTKKDIDVIVAYIANRNIWYVVPVQAFVPRKNLWFYPDGSKKGAMFEKFRDAWWVMTRERRKR